MNWDVLRAYVVDSWRLLLQMTLAAGLAGLVGWEREKQKKPAGLRTFMLVGIGSAAFTIVTMRLYDEVAASEGRIGADPIRIISGVIGGLGFLGAGTIIQAGQSVQGITTAAMIWVTGGIGVACGLEYYSVAVSVVLLSYLTLRLDELLQRKKQG